MRVLHRQLANLGFGQNCHFRYAGDVNDDGEGEADEELTDNSEDGVDLTLIRWMLSLTPEDRLRFSDKRINEVRAIRELNGI